MAHRRFYFPWLGILKFMWIATLTICMYVLGVAMVRHHYTHGTLDYHQWRDSR